MRRIQPRAADRVDGGCGTRGCGWLNATREWVKPAATAYNRSPNGWTDWRAWEGHGGGMLAGGHSMDEIAMQQVLEVVADFDESGGASSGLVAWELFVDEQRIAGPWAQAQSDGLLKPAAHDGVNDEQMWRLTAGGWAARTDPARRA